MNDMKNISDDVPIGCIKAHHAGPQIAAHNPDARAFGISRALCPGCQSFFRRYAQYHGASIAVSTPVQDYIFRSNGTVIPVPRQEP